MSNPQKLEPALARDPRAEQFLFDRLVEAAPSSGVREIAGVFRPTAKNALVRDLFHQLCSEQVSNAPDEIRYRFAPPKGIVHTATHVKMEPGHLDAPITLPA